MGHIKNQWMSGQPHRGHLAALAGWLARYVALFFHHLSFTTFLKVKYYQKYQSLLISVAQRAWFLMSYMISEVYSLQWTLNNFKILMFIFLFFSLLIFESMMIRIMIWKNPVVDHHHLFHQYSSSMNPHSSIVRSFK